EGQKASFDGPDGVTFTTSNWYLSGRFAFTENFAAVAELPFAHGGVETLEFTGNFDSLGNPIFASGTESDNVLGNPYLGVEFHFPNSSFSMELGGRPPLGSLGITEEGELSSFLAFFTDYDRFEAFFPDLVFATWKVGLSHTSPTGLITRFRLGPSFMASTAGGEPELFADYSAQGGYQGNTFTFWTGLTGRAILTEGDLSFGERTVHQFGLSGHFTAGRFIPGLLLRLPMDADLDDVLDFVFGFNVAYRLP
ncbi:MAG: hypothetical protein L0209_01270, partial [candidate division Zixibacteria bacterium]|nr:hypothetical protein [candidate division Zixibacteria bacterium]